MRAVPYSNLRSSPHIAESVRDARRRLGFAQADLAEAAGVSLRTISSIESGTGNPNALTLIAVLRALKLDLMFWPQEGIDTASGEQASPHA